MKKFTFLLSVLFVAFISTFLTSCDEAPKTRTEMLTADIGWRITSCTCTPAYFGSTNYYSTFSSCSKDDIDFYYSTGEYIFDENTKKCGTKSYTDLGNWSLSADENTLFIDSSVGEDPREFNIIQLTETKFTYTEDVILDDKKLHTLTYTHIAE
jgi:hypothetical protein